MDILLGSIASLLVLPHRYSRAGTARASTIRNVRVAFGQELILFSGTLLSIEGIHTSARLATGSPPR